MQHLDRDATTEHDVVGEVHGGGRPGADGGQQPVTATEHLTDTVDHARDGHSPTLQVAPVEFGYPSAGGGHRRPDCRATAPGGHTVGVSDAQTPPPAAPTARPRRKLQPHHAVFALLIVVVVVCVVVLFKKAQSGSNGLDNAAIDRLIPAPNAKILAQDTVGIDLADGYTATLTLNGAASPTTSSRSSRSSTRSRSPLVPRRTPS